ncbi:HD domain-containing protein [Chryseobacterium gossypii]|uniref:HD domain-containing protein n=1 Tax=Chryseobacterium gossypii TaxID=3231602 RepID=UPI0035254EEF
MSLNRPKIVAGIEIPDSSLAKQATELLIEHGSDFLYNHSLRAFIFASWSGGQRKLEYDPELLYICSVFHDLGLTPHYSSPDKRFEVDGADAARDFLKQHGVPQQTLQLVWDAIALHTTPGIVEYKESEAVLLNAGIALDVVGKGYENLPDKLREEIIYHFPRTDFKKIIIPAFYEGFKHKPHTTFGNMNADICACMNPDFQKPNFCDAIIHSPWSE